MAKSTQRIDAPMESTGDKVHAIIKGGIGALPMVGSMAAEVFGMVVTSPYQRRQAAWMDTIGAKLQEIEERQGQTIEDLSSDSGFIDTLLQATQAAMRTSNDRKLLALRNAIVNSSHAHRPDDSKRQIFVNMVDELTPSHLQLLDLLVDPPAWFQKNRLQLPQYSLVSSLERLIGDALPGLASQRDFWELLVRDLQRRGLLYEFNIGITMSGGGAFEGRGTKLGQAFLQFISEQ